MLMSLHEHNKLFYAENTDTLEEAWRLQPERLAGRSMGKQPLHPRMYQYEQIAQLGRQVQRAMHIFPREQIKTIIFNDFISDTRAVYEDVLAFLGVSSDGRTHFPRTNRQRAYRHPKLTWPLFRTIHILSHLRVKMGILTNTQILSMLLPVLTRPIQKQQSNLSPEFREELVEAFREDVNLLSELLHRDLRGWLLEPNDYLISSDRD